MKKLLLLISCFCLLSCNPERTDSNPSFERGDRIHVKNTEVIGTISRIYASDYVEFYYEDDFGTLQKQDLNVRFLEKVIDNP